MCIDLFTIQEMITQLALCGCIVKEEAIEIDVERGVPYFDTIPKKIVVFRVYRNNLPLPYKWSPSSTPYSQLRHCFGKLIKAAFIKAFDEIKNAPELSNAFN